MLKEILAITGKPGLFKIVSHNGKTLIVEEMTTGKKFPVSPRDRIVSLADVAMYTEEGERELGLILDTMYEKREGKAIDMKEAKENIKGLFVEYVPDYDTERVHDSDIRKLFNWYNLLVEKGFTKFTEEMTTDSPKGDENKESAAE